MSSQKSRNAAGLLSGVCRLACHVSSKSQVSIMPNFTRTPCMGRERTRTTSLAVLGDVPDALPVWCSTAGAGLEPVLPAGKDAAFSGVFRSKGTVWLDCGFLYSTSWSHAGRQLRVNRGGVWWGTLPEQVILVCRILVTCKCEANCEASEPILVVCRSNLRPKTREVIGGGSRVGHNVACTRDTTQGVLV